MIRPLPHRCRNALPTHPNFTLTRHSLINRSFIYRFVPLGTIRIHATTCICAQGTTTFTYCSHGNRHAFPPNILPRNYDSVPIFTNAIAISPSSSFAQIDSSILHTHNLPSLTQRVLHWTFLVPAIAGINASPGSLNGFLIGM